LTTVKVKKRDKKEFVKINIIDSLRTNEDNTKGMIDNLKESFSEKMNDEEKKCLEKWCSNDVNDDSKTECDL